MGSGAVEVLGEGTLLMQHAVENIRRDPARRETGDLGGQCKSLRRHGTETIWENGMAIRTSIYAIARRTPVSREYAKCKNPPTDFTAAASSVGGTVVSRGKSMMTDDPSRPAAAA